MRDLSFTDLSFSDVIETHSTDDLIDQYLKLPVPPRKLLVWGNFSLFPMLPSLKHIKNLAVNSSGLYRWPDALNTCTYLESLQLKSTVVHYDLAPFKFLKILQLIIDYPLEHGIQLSLLGLGELPLEEFVFTVKKAFPHDVHYLDDLLYVKSLKRLKVEHAFSCIPPVIEKLSQLEVLSLIDNAFIVPALAMPIPTLAFCVKDLRSLKTLSLYNVSLSHLTGLSELRQLEHLCIENQSLHRVLIHKNLACLQELVLISPKLTKIPDLRYLPNLQTVHIRTSTTLEFPPSIKYCTNLRELTWQSNAPIHLDGLGECLSLRCLCLETTQEVIFPFEAGKINLMELRFLNNACMKKIVFPEVVLGWSFIRKSINIPCLPWEKDFCLAFENNQKLLQTALPIIHALHLLGQWYRSCIRSARPSNGDTPKQLKKKADQNNIATVLYVLSIPIIEWSLPEAVADNLEHYPNRWLASIITRCRIIEGIFSEEPHIPKEPYDFFTSVILNKGPGPTLFCNRPLSCERATSSPNKKKSKLSRPKQRRYRESLQRTLNFATTLQHCLP